MSRTSDPNRIAATAVKAWFDAMLSTAEATPRAAFIKSAWMPRSIASKMPSDNSGPKTTVL